MSYFCGDGVYAKRGIKWSWKEGRRVLGGEKGREKTNQEANIVIFSNGKYSLIHCKQLLIFPCNYYVHLLVIWWRESYLALCTMAHNYIIESLWEIKDLVFKQLRTEWLFHKHEPLFIFCAFSFLFSFKLGVSHNSPGWLETHYVAVEFVASLLNAGIVGMSPNVWCTYVYVSLCVYESTCMCVYTQMCVCMCLIRIYAWVGAWGLGCAMMCV